MSSASLSHADGRADRASGSPRSGAVVAVLACAGIVVSLMQTLVVPLIPKLPLLLHAPASDTAWVLTATLLAGAVATPVAGRLGDMYGKRRILTASVLLLIAGSATCALSDSLAPVVVGRALQGCGAGVIPLGISIMRDELPPQRLGAAMALMSSSLGVGGALGVPASAAVAQHFDWHVLFWGSAGLSALMVVLTLVFVPESPVRSGGRFDLAGTLGLSGGLVCLLLAISKGGDWGWSSATTLSLFGAAAVVLPVWGWWELRAAEPLVDLRTATRRQVLMTNAASVMVGFAMYAMSLVVPQLLQLPRATGYGLGRTMMTAGLCMMPSGLMMMLISPLSARLSTARGPKVSLLTGAVVIAAGYATALGMTHSVWQIVLATCVISAGIGFAYAAMPALIMSAVPVSETAAANGLNTLMRSIGTSTSSAVVGVVLAHLTIRYGPVVLPSLNGFRVAFGISGAAAVVAVLIALFIPGRARTPVVGAPVPHGVEKTGAARR